MTKVKCSKNPNNKLTASIKYIRTVLLGLKALSLCKLSHLQEYMETNHFVTGLDRTNVM